MFLYKSSIWEKYCSLDIGQNAFSHSDYRIFKSSISPEQIGKTASFFACWYKFTKIKIWLKSFSVGHGQKCVWPINLVHFTQMKGDRKFFGVSMFKNGCGQSGDGTVKLTVSEEWTDRINWFFACWFFAEFWRSWFKHESHL